MHCELDGNLTSTAKLNLITDTVTRPAQMSERPVGGGLLTVGVEMHRTTGSRLLSGALTVVLTATTAGAVLLGGATAAHAAPSARHKSTDFAFYAQGHGTKIRGGQVPAGSRTTAFQAIGCTNVAGITKRNEVTDATLPGAGTASDITTKVMTRYRHGVASSITKTSVAKVVLGEGSGLGTVTLRAINATARASHGPDGFHASFTSTLGKIVFTPPVGPSQEIPVPSPGQYVDIPGLVRIGLGGDNSRTSGSMARAAGYAVVIRMIPTNTKIDIGRGRTIVAKDVKVGLFHGNSAAIDTTALAGNVKVGRQPLSIIPCQGSQGILREKALAGINLDGGLVVNGLRSAYVGDQTDRAAFGRTIGEVASVNLGGGQLVVDAIRGVARVKRTAHGVKRSIRGSSVGTITANGQPQTFPDTGVLEIPGVAKLERNVTHKGKIGISVVALRITLLDGSGAVINLGSAHLAIRKKH